MSRGTFKPCPGCRGTRHRGAGDVCDDCKKALAIGYAHLEQTAIDGKKEPKKLFRLTADWPTFVCVMDPFAQNDLRDAFKRLARQVFRRSMKNVAPYDDAVIQFPKEKHDIHRSYFSTYDEEAVVYEGTESMAHAIDRLDTAVRAALRTASDKGEESGREFIRQVVQGKVTMADITEETIEASKARRKR
jgi:hypothetical protein